MPIATVTCLKVKSIWQLLPFLRWSKRCFKQAEACEGYITHTMRRTSGLTFWTLSLWEDEAAMKAFVRSGVHKEVLPKFHTMAASGSTGHWEHEGRELPNWATVEAKLEEHGREHPVRPSK